jgi:hypothetical protein
MRPEAALERLDYATERALLIHESASPWNEG